MERAAAGNILARLGDPRVEVVPRTLDDLGQTEFCYVPPGPFLMGDEGRENTSLTEGNWIARQPVTVAQFAWFVQEGATDTPSSGRRPSRLGAGRRAGSSPLATTGSLRRGMPVSRLTN